jgi:hypothetical protein
MRVSSERVFLLLNATTPTQGGGAEEALELAQKSLVKRRTTREFLLVRHRRAFQRYPRGKMRR